jgi:hypothetical protein
MIISWNLRNIWIKTHKVPMCEQILSSTCIAFALVSLCVLQLGCLALCDFVVKSLFSLYKCQVFLEDSYLLSVPGFVIKMSLCIGMRGSTLCTDYMQICMQIYYSNRTACQMFMFILIISLHRLVLSSIYHQLFLQASYVNYDKNTTRFIT